MIMNMNRLTSLLLQHKLQGKSLVKIDNFGLTLVGYRLSEYFSYCKGFLGGWPLR